MYLEGNAPLWAKPGRSNAFAFFETGLQGQEERFMIKHVVFMKFKKEARP